MLRDLQILFYTFILRSALHTNTYICMYIGINKAKVSLSIMFLLKFLNFLSLLEIFSTIAAVDLLSKRFKGSKILNLKLMRSKGRQQVRNALRIAFNQSETHKLNGS